MAILDEQCRVRVLASCSLEDRFLVRCLTSRAVGLWAASLLGIDGEQATLHAQNLVIDTLSPGELNYIERLRPDFQAKGVEMSDHRIDAKVAQCREAAERKVAHRFWSEGANGEVRWERRKQSRSEISSLALPPVLQAWQKNRIENGLGTAHVR